MKHVAHSDKKTTAETKLVIVGGTETPLWNQTLEEFSIYDEHLPPGISIEIIIEEVFDVDIVADMSDVFLDMADVEEVSCIFLFF